MGGNGDIAEATKSALDGHTPPGFSKPISVSFTLPPKKSQLQMLQQSRRRRSTRSTFVPRRHHGLGSGWHDYYSSPSLEHQPTWKDRWRQRSGGGVNSGSNGICVARNSRIVENEEKSSGATRGGVNIEGGGRCSGVREGERSEEGGAGVDAREGGSVARTIGEVESGEATAVSGGGRRGGKVGNVARPWKGNRRNQYNEPNASGHRYLPTPGWKGGATPKPRKGNGNLDQMSAVDIPTFQRTRPRGPYPGWDPCDSWDPYGHPSYN